MKKNNPLEIRKLCKQFDGQKRMALDALDLIAKPGKIRGIVGPDGAGKTTLLRVIAGLMHATGGEVEVLGLPMPLNAEKVRERISYMPQKFGLYEDLTVIENLNLYADLRNCLGEERKRIFGELLAFTDLEAFQSRRAGALSGGMKQKLGLACSLIARPKLLLLDEPSVGVDPISRRELWKMVKELSGDGMAVIWSTAYLDEAEQCDQVTLLNEGKTLYSGDPSELTEKVSERTFLLRGFDGQRRNRLTELLSLDGVKDGVIEGDAIRILTDSPAATADLQAFLDRQQQQLIPVTARFEDAFMDLLGGGPKGPSRLADKIEFKPSEPGTTTVEAVHLTKQFGDFKATDDVSFTIQPGEVFGLLGPNGAGKSTTFKMMCGLLTPTHGEALVKGVSLKLASGEARQKIGYMAQKFSLYGALTVEENLKFFSGVYGLHGSVQREQVQMMTETFELGPFLRKGAETLPLGYKQRLALACAVMHRPDILFLDEPTSGVDPQTRREFWSHINGLVAKGVTIMVTTHFMDEAEYCDRIGLVYRGSLIALDTPANLKAGVASDVLKNPTMEQAFIELIQRNEQGVAV